jgi:DNA-binding NtrC family response regulator
MRVLIVEDDSDYALYLKLALERLGVETMAVGGVVTAIAAVIRDHFDVVIIDYTMTLDYPLTGLNVAGWTHMADPGTVLVVISGHPRQELEDRNGGALPPWVEFIPKPVSVDTLTAVLERAGDQ